MGFDLQITRFILEAKRSGCDFSDAVTLGRQNIDISRNILKREIERFGLDISDKDIAHIFSTYPYVDGLMELLGAKESLSIDASNYEGAPIIADMNLPSPEKCTGRFSLIIDGGTLEHVFNFPQAAKNVSTMLKVGGHFISINGANNYMGHGFYQFSPELFFRVFSPENGFAVEQMILTEVNDDGVWYEVTDPAVAHSRVQLINNARTYIMMRARKIASCAMFKEMPQQSDYHDSAWQPDTGPDLERAFLRRPFSQRIVETFPRPARLVFRRLFQAVRNHFSSEHLKKYRQF